MWLQDKADLKRMVRVIDAALLLVNAASVCEEIKEFIKNKCNSTVAVEACKFRGRQERDKNGLRGDYPLKN